MTPAEMKTIRESLGLTAQWLADNLPKPVQLRTVQYWESGRMPVPEDVAAMLQGMDARFNEIAAKALEMAEDAGAPHVALLRYRTDADLWKYRPDMKPLPCAAHAALIARTSHEILGAGIGCTIQFLDADEYEAWRGDRPDSETLRAEWAALK